MAHQIGIGCDGTRASDRPGQYRDSNVVRIVREFSNDPIYIPGVGAGQRLKVLRYVTGWGVAAKAREAQKKLEASYEEAQTFLYPEDIKVFGICWSRGHLSLLRAIEKSQIRVDALVIIDAVSSVGEPLFFNLMDRRYPQDIPSNVQYCLHLVALHETDLGFRLKSFPERSGLSTVALPGDHTELGRGGLAYRMSSEFLRLHGFLQFQQDTLGDEWGQPTRKMAQDLQDYQSWLQSLKN